MGLSAAMPHEKSLSIVESATTHVELPASLLTFLAKSLYYTTQCCGEQHVFVPFSVILFVESCSTFDK